MRSNMALVILAGSQLKLKGIDLTFEGEQGVIYPEARHPLGISLVRGKTVILKVEYQWRMWRPDSCSS
jgi:hypothetical protein